MDQNQMLMEYLMSAAEQTPQREDIARKRAVATQLRQGGKLPGMRDAGRVQQAAHPLEFLSSLANTGASAYTGSQADAQEDLYGAERRRKLTELRDRMWPQQAAGTTPNPS